ncbi:aminoglycoside phosphotransferase (APT) family kinase protein [Rhodoligotrophos appendicifer]|uniref:phosphotransferase family protein n=1 Tax=Rhodoligotrophos appendicifer TaxID=987056 RepID=UPI001185B201|nr:phosphotransferase family protein [Rhodoligotrophos appendicifer]
MTEKRTDRIDRQKEFSGVDEVRAAHRFDEAALAAYMADHVEGFRGPLQVEQFKGGQSNPTYRLSAPSGRYVLRRKPPGKLLPSAHAVDREYKVISALHAQGFPVARPVVLCEDDAVIGTAFYVMDFVDGRVFWEPSAPGIGREERAALYDGLNATIAQLHSYDHQAIGLGSFGRPEGYVARQIKRWSEQYKASATASIPAMDRLMDWLPGACPATTDAAIVHGDFRLDNTIIAPGKPKILAVLDWELSTIGDPIADFTYHLMQWRMPPSETGAGVGTLVGHDLNALGLPSLEDYIERYCERTGRQGIAEIDFYLAYNFFRMAAIFQGIVGRVRDGTAANPKAAAMATQVAPMAEVAWTYAKAAGA